MASSIANDCVPVRPRGERRDGHDTSRRTGDGDPAATRVRTTPWQTRGTPPKNRDGGQSAGNCDSGTCLPVTATPSIPDPAALGPDRPPADRVSPELLSLAPFGTNLVRSASGPPRADPLGSDGTCRSATRRAVAPADAKSILPDPSTAALPLAAPGRLTGTECVPAVVTSSTLATDARNPRRERRETATRTESPVDAWVEPTKDAANSNGAWPDDEPGRSVQRTEDPGPPHADDRAAVLSSSERRSWRSFRRRFRTDDSRILAVAEAAASPPSAAAILARHASAALPAATPRPGHVPTAAAALSR